MSIETKGNIILDDLTCQSDEVWYHIVVDAFKLFNKKIRISLIDQDFQWKQ